MADQALREQAKVSLFGRLGSGEAFGDWGRAGKKLKRFGSTTDPGSNL